MVLMLLACASPALPVKAQVPPGATRPRQVLHLNSYHPGYVWSDDISGGIRETLTNSGIPIEIFTEHLDSRRFPTGDHLAAVANHLQAKYGTTDFDVVIVSDNAAFDFALENRDLIFPGSPIVFCGYNGFRIPEHPHLENVTGISEEIDVPGGLQLARQLQGELEEMIFIGSTHDLTFGRVYRLFAEETAPQLQQLGLPLRILVDLPIEQLLPILNEATGNAAVFILGPVTSLLQKTPLSPEESARRIAAASPVPVYGFLDLNINTGALGGWVVEGREQGAYAAELALKILNGADADDLPVQMRTPHAAVLDFAALKKHNIDLKRVPDGAILYGKDESLLARYGKYILAGGSLIILQTGLILLLLRAVTGRKRAFLMLQEERNALDTRVQERTKDLASANKTLSSREALFSGMFDRHIDIMLLVDPRSQIILKANQAAVRFYGCQREELEGRRLADFEVHTVNGSGQKRSHGEIFHHTYETRHQLPNGQTREIEIRSSRIIVEGNEILYCVIQDHSERHRMERLKEDIDRITRHDLKSPLNAVIGMPQYILESHGNLPPDIVEALRVVIDSAQSMANLVQLSDKMLLMEQDAYQCSPEPVEMISLLRRITLEQRVLIDHKHTTLRIEGGEPGPDGLQFIVLGEELLCYSILTNLIKNALEATPHECPVRVSLSLKEGQAEIRVHNWGEVPHDIRGRFFEKYVTSGKRNGTGLGTYSAKLLAETMGGSLEMRSSVDQGTELLLRMAHLSR